MDPQRTQVPPLLPHQAMARTRGYERVGDVERSHVCDRLSAAFSAGQLDDAELEDRLAAAVSARTENDLVLLLHDLAPLAAPARPALVPPEPKAAWNAADILALLVLIGCSLAVCAMLLILAGVDPPYLFFSVFGGSLAFWAGVSARQLVHRAARRARETASGA